MENSDLNLICDDVHVVTNVLKRFLRRLPDPIISFEIYDPLISLVKDDKLIEKLPLIQNEETDIDVKKRMLVVLANIDDVTVYRTIENLSRQESPIQKWAIIALQQSRMLLQSTLLDDPGIFISTGLGGHGLLLRYFCVFFNRIPGELPVFQQNTLKNELKTLICKAQGTIENIEFKPDFTTVLLLLPLQTELQVLFAGLIDECNLYGNFLHENMIVTNVKKLTDEEICQLLHHNNPREVLK